VCVSFGNERWGDQACTNMASAFLSEKEGRESVPVVLVEQRLKLVLNDDLILPLIHPHHVRRIHTMTTSGREKGGREGGREGGTTNLLYL